MVQESPSQTVVRYSASFFAQLFGLSAIIIKFGGYITYIFGLLIILIEDLRVSFLNWAVISIILGYLINKIAGFLFLKYGPVTLKIDEKILTFSPNLVYRTFFSANKKFEHQFILHYEFHERSYLPNKYSVFTTDDKFEINLFRWRKQNELNVTIQKLAIEKDNIYVRNAYYKNTVRNSMKSILRTTQGKIGGFILLIYLTMTILGGISYIFYPPNASSPTSGLLFNPEYILYFLPQYNDYGVLTPPNSDFWFGTDYIGRDVFSRMIFGTFITIGISLVAALIITLLITVIGLTSAIYGGFWDDFITRLSDVLLTFPQVVWIVLISVFSTPFRIGIPGGFYLAVYLGMSLVMWPLGARLVRSEVLEALSAEYVQAVDLVGAGRGWIIKKHIFPKVLPTLFLLFFYQLTDIVIGISLLGYLGFGSESTIVWGSDLAKSFIEIDQASDIQNEWWTVVFPSIFIFGIVLGLTLFSDALRDVYASKFRGGRTGTLHSSIGGRE